MILLWAHSDNHSENEQRHAEAPQFSVTLILSSDVPDLQFFSHNNADFSPEVKSGTPWQSLK